MAAIALALGASVLWGVGDFLGGVGARRLATLAVVAISHVAGLVAVTIVATAAAGEFLGGEALLAAAGAGVAGAVGLAALYRGMAVGAMGVVAPISASAAVLPVVVALLGVVFVAREPEAVRGLAAGVPLALLAAVGFGSYFVLMDRASADDAYWAVIAARATSSSLTLALAGARGALRVPLRALPLLIAIGVFDVGSNVLLALALNEGFVSLVSVLSSLYPVLTVLLAIAVLRERPSRTQALGGAAALAGVAMISAAA